MLEEKKREKSNTLSNPTEAAIWVTDRVLPNSSSQARFNLTCVK